MTRPLGAPTLHFFLTRSVARVLGVNLTEAMRDGRLSADRYAAVVTRCRSCPVAGECQTWLATCTSTPDGPPEGCRNADVYAKLMRES
mgnify:CR=1 FL=1